jgi:ABC-type bacteriocin/lantibiotic exporter with double-glycine peptidase domain
MYFSSQTGIDKDSRITGFYLNEEVRIIQETIGAYRFIRFFHDKNIFSKNFKTVLQVLLQAQKNITIRGLMPKPILDTIIIIIFVTIIYWIFSISENSYNVSSIIIFIFATTRLIPALNILYVSFIGYIGSNDNMNYVLKVMNIEDKLKYNSEGIIHITNKITINDICFSYETNIDNVVLKNISFEIKKGTIFGIFGPSGSGKSTLIDVILGILRPSSGSILYNGIDYNYLQRTKNEFYRINAGIVPQTVFLFNESIIFNITLNNDISKIDFKYLNCIISDCKLDFIYNLPLGLNTQIGENGYSISGGQRQRIGIARALYLKSDLLVMDESTNALDDYTENSLMSNIKSNYKNLTVLFISHNTSLKIFCNDYFEFK